MRANFWDRAWTGWHVATLTVLGLVAVDVAVDGQQPVTGRLLVVALIVVAAVWQVLVGVPAARVADTVTPGVRYAVGLVVVFAAAVFLEPDASYLLGAFVPNLYAVVRRFGIATAANCLLFALSAASMLARDGWSEVGWGSLAVSTLVPLGFSVVAGGWITGVVRQSVRRAELIEEMQRTREELAASRYEAGVRAERERLAAEIHDTLTQGFASVVLLSQAARGSLDRDPAAARAQLDAIEQTSRDNLAEARSLVFALAPADLTGGSLADAVRRIASRHTRDTGVPVSVTVSGGPADGSPRVDVVVLRACQEALHNVRRHAEATSVTIELDLTGTSVVLSVADDGRGFAPDGPGPGLGLSGMRQRVESCAGTMTVASTDDGTVLRVALPLEVA